MADTAEIKRLPYLKGLLLIPILLILIEIGITLKPGGTTPSPRAAAEKIVILTIKPGEEVSYQIPSRCWFRVYSRDNVEATTWEGRRVKNVAWLGDEIRDANFVLKSNEKEKDARVIITLRPK